MNSRSRRASLQAQVEQPEKPQLALAVGVTGHRPTRLPLECNNKVGADIFTIVEMLRRKMELARERYKAYYGNDPSLLSVVSALAEGADRIAARVALDNQISLDVVLPTERASYESDFDSPASVDEFRRLVSAARSVLALPGNRADVMYHYQQVGRAVVSQSDILLAVWDGGPSEGPGGTADIVALAARAGIPIIHVDANGAISPKILWNGFGNFTPVESIQDVASADFGDKLGDLVEKLVCPPVADYERESIADYFTERIPKYMLRIEFRMLMAALGIRPLDRHDIFSSTPEKCREIYSRSVAAAGGGDAELLAQAYGWSDAVASRFGQIFRSAFVMNFALGSFAVLLAVSSLFGVHKLLFVVPEIALIVAVLANTWIGRERRWHKRWLEARELSERLRIAFLFWILGRRFSTSSSRPEPSWAGWYARALVRAQGLRSGVLNAAGLNATRSAIIQLIEDQCAYHKRNEREMEMIERRLERVGSIFFGLAFATASFYVVWDLSYRFGLHNPLGGYTELFKYLVIAATAGLPALATATYGIRIIGDFEGVARRSARSLAALEQIQHDVASGPVDLDFLHAKVRAATEVMLGDVEIWRLGAESRTLAIPG